MSSKARVDPALLAGSWCWSGRPAIGVLDYQDTPLGERMPGSEIHAQLLENLFDGTLLHARHGRRRVEAVAFVLLRLAADHARMRRVAPAARHS